VVHCSASRDLFCFEAVQALLERVAVPFPPGCLEVSVSISEQIPYGHSSKILDSGRKLENRDEGCPNGSVQTRVEIAGCFPISPAFAALT
jgi:hypothetical protein